MNVNTINRARIGRSQQPKDRRINLISQNHQYQIQGEVILVPVNQELIPFGLAEPFVGDIPFFQDRVNRTYRLFVQRRDIISCILFILMLYYTFSVPKVLSAMNKDFKIDNRWNTGLVNDSLNSKEQDNMCYIKAMIQNLLNVCLNDNENGFIVNKKSDSDEVLQEDTIVKESVGLTCTIAEGIRFAMSKLFCWKDDDANLMQNKSNKYEGVFNYELTNISASITNAVEEIGESLSCIKTFFIDIINDIMENRRSPINRQCDLEQSILDTSFGEEPNVKMMMKIQLSLH